MLFAVGARRSGTLWLQRIVAAHPLASALPTETHLFSYGLSQVFDRLQHGLISSHRVGSVFADRAEVVEAARSLCDAVFARFLERDSRLLVERTPWHAYHLDLIAEVYPDARVLHIIRDGRDVARSLVAQPWGPTTVREAALEWRTSVETARAARMPEARYLEVRYEDLLAEPEAGIRRLYEWLDLPPGAGVLEAALAEAGARANLGADRAVSTAKWRREWGRSELRAFDDTAGALLEELGYGSRPLPGGGDRARRAARRLRSFIRPGKAHTAPARATPDAAPTRPQRALEKVIEAIQDDRTDELRKISASATAFRIVDGSNVSHARGEAGLELLAMHLRSDAAFRGRQVHGESYPGVPTTTVSLAYEVPEGGIESRLLMVAIRDDRLTELTVIRPARSTAPSPAAVSP